MGLIREDGTRKLALEHFARHTPAMGIMQWFHFEDYRPGGTVARLKALVVTHLRTGLCRAERFRRGCEARFDRQIEALQGSQSPAAFCFAPLSEGLAPSHTSPPKDQMHFADFCARTIERYAPARPAEKAVA